jgi:hypothetical protein
MKRKLVGSAGVLKNGDSQQGNQSQERFEAQSVLILIDRLRAEMPPAFTRKTACKLMGGLLSPGTLANLDSAGAGPRGIRAGKAVLYERESFLEWLGKRMKAEVDHG